MKNRMYYGVAVLLLGIIMLTGYGGLCDKEKSDSGSSASVSNKAGNPSPSNGATGVARPVVYAYSYGVVTELDFYHGTTNPPPYVGTEVVRWWEGLPYENENPVPWSTLSNCLPYTKYYWRIDCKNFSVITTGDVWSFTTGP